VLGDAIAASCGLFACPTAAHTASGGLKSAPSCPVQNSPHQYFSCPSDVRHPDLRRHMIWTRRRVLPHRHLAPQFFETTIFAAEHR